MKVGDYVFVRDGFDITPRLRVVMEINKRGIVCRTAESDIGLLFWPQHVQLAEPADFQKWQRQNLGFVWEDE